MQQINKPKLPMYNSDRIRRRLNTVMATVWGHIELGYRNTRLFTINHKIMYVSKKMLCSICLHCSSAFYQNSNQPESFALVLSSFCLYSVDMKKEEYKRHKEREKGRERKILKRERKTKRLRVRTRCVICGDVKQ